MYPSHWAPSMTPVQEQPLWGEDITQEEITPEQREIKPFPPIFLPNNLKQPLSLFISGQGFIPKVFPNKKKKITKPLGIKKLSELTRREKEAVGELFVASVGCTALAVSWRNAEVGPHTAGQVLWDTRYLCLHWGTWTEMTRKVIPALIAKRKLFHTADRLHARPCVD